MRYIAIIILYTFLTISSAWAISPFGTITIADEIKMGQEFDQQILRTMPVITDPEIAPYIKGLVDKLVANKKKMQFKTTTRVISNPTMNAFAVPGGYVYVFTGLIVNVETEGQLAAVLAHELGHVSQRHVAKRMEDMQGTQAATALAMLGGIFLGAGGNSNAAQAVIVGSQALGTAAYLNYTQENERDADHVGITNLVASGYNPESMPQTFEIMKKKSGVTRSKDYPSYLSTHPGLTERISYLKGRIMRMPPEYLNCEEDNTAFKRVQTIIRATQPDPEVAISYYTTKDPDSFTAMDYLGKAYLLKRLNKYAEAKATIAKAVALAPKDYMVQREAGIIAFEQKEYGKAAIYLQKASLYNPRDGETLYYLAKMFEHSGQKSAALKTMKKAVQEAPTLGMTRIGYARMLGQNGDLFNAHLQLAYGYYYQKNAKKFLISKRKVQGLAKSEEQQEALKELLATTKGFGKKK